jgi:peptidoglycan hydrolase CwlO-like protein
MLVSRTVPLRMLSALAIATVLAVLGLGVGDGAPARGADLGSLQSNLGSAQARAAGLSSSLAGLQSSISRLGAQVALVQSREADVRAELSADRRQLATAAVQATRERARLARLRAQLKRAQMILAAQLVSSYEGSRPDLMSVVVDAHGFTQLLEQLDFLRRAQNEQQLAIAVTRRARERASVATARLERLQARDAQATEAADVRVRALAGMNALLSSREAALARARAAQQAALAAARANVGRLQSAISRIRAQQAATAAAAAARAAAASAAPTEAAASAPVVAAGSSSAVPSGGWAIPAAIVMCESGGQNLPPNSAGASGYYQILPSTWKGEGGPGPAAYLASKAAQDAVAARLWAGGAGASNWVCAGILGIR